MCMRAYSRETRLAVEKLIKEHVKQTRTNIPWSGENADVAKKIMKLFRK